MDSSSSARDLTSRHTQPLAALALAIIGVLSAAGCGPERSQGAGGDFEQRVAAVFTNGDFESSNMGDVPASWTTSVNKNPAITDTRPSSQTLSSLNLGSGGYAATFVVGGTAESQTDPDLG